MPGRLDFIQSANPAYFEQMYARYREDPGSVPDDWAIFFAGFELAEGRSPGPATAEPGSVVGGVAAGTSVAGLSGAALMPAEPGVAGCAGGAAVAPAPRAAGAAAAVAPVAAGPTAGVFGLVLAYREFGHLIARIDPLGDNLETHPLLDLTNFGLSEGDLDREVDPRPLTGNFRGTLRQLIAALRETYCSTLGVEYMDISDKRRRDWLQQRMEGDRNRPSLSPEQRIRILESLLFADAFEHFLHVRYVGQKRFSLEGGATLIPMLEHLVEAAAGMGVEQLVIGMPHRGRLNVLVNILKKPLEMVFNEFESGRKPEEVQGHGDVKYHMGYSSLHAGQSGHIIHLDLNFNPSHLEFVNPVVLGSVRARQTYMNDPEGERGVPVLIHGDAAFAGEGIVAETLTLAQLPAYRTGGTIHIIVNNQIGFTTSPEDGRPTRYPTDIARVVGAPVFHVNGDDPETAVHAIALATAYRAAFKQDAFVDLVCYRKHGHNELDDPTFTQPAMYRKIARHVPASRQYAQRLIREGVIDAARLEAIEKSIAERLDAAQKRARAETSVNGEVPLGGAWQGFEWSGEDWSAETAVPQRTLERVVRGAASLPAGFHPHPKVAKLLEERVEMVGQDRIDWGSGEVLAFGSLLLEGFHVRLSGQDTGRGTFSHRHAILYDAEDGARFVPLQHLDPAQGRFDVIDTMLSEAAALGFEYGYTTADPNTLVIWEAQFGDFANVAQVYIDQFIASAESKWRRMSGITLLLPHGYEGQGPEHSSARLERFLELCADGNVQVCNLTTPAQLFHALRRQMHRKFRKPLVIMSPKSLLRHRLAVSPLHELTSGSFHNAIDDVAAPDPLEVRTVLLTSGRFFFTLFEARAARNAADVALVRVEQLYPFPRVELSEIFKRYPKARDIRWVQEEPANMGAWRQSRHRLESVLPEGATLRVVARRASPTPATGYYPMHLEQEEKLVEKAFGDPEALPRVVPSAASRAGARPRASS